LGLRQQGRLSDRQPWDLDVDSEQLREDRRMLVERHDAAARAVRDLSTKASERDKQLSEARANLLELEDRRTLRRSGSTWPTPF
jgi:chromosome segregation ATPase